MGSVKTYTAWIIGFISALLATFLIFFKLTTMWFDETYINSLNLPTDADSVGIPLFGAVLFGCFVFLVVTSIYIALMILHVSHRSFSKHVRITDGLLKRGAIKQNIAKLIFIALTLLWIVLLYLPPLYEYVNGLYVITDIASVLFALVSLTMTCMTIDRLGYN